MEVAVSRCGSTIPIEFTHGLRHFSQADRRRRTVFSVRRFSGFIFRAGFRQFHFRRDDKCRMVTGNLGAGFSFFALISGNFIFGVNELRRFLPRMTFAVTPKMKLPEQKEKRNLKIRES